MSKVFISGLAWIDVTDFDLRKIAALKSSLTISPRRTSKHQTAEQLAPIELFVQKESMIGVPREFFMKNRKMEHDTVQRVTPGRKWADSYESAFTLRDDQPEAVEAVMKRMTAPFGGAIVQAPTGWGKSQRFGTPILKYDGVIVPVETLKVGDKIMGPDSRPRTILSTHADFGPMYKIVPVKGEPWFCNDVHILTLVHTETNEIVDIEIGDYLKKSAYWKHCHKQFSPEHGIDFESAKPVPLDPYFLGVWLGDGSKDLNDVSVSKPDREILALCEEIAKEFGLHVRTEFKDGKDNTHHIVVEHGSGRNPLLDLLRKVVGDASVFPKLYMTGSREERLKLLAGLLDADGFHNNGCFEIVQKRKAYADGIMFVARSLGFFARAKEKMVKLDGWDEPRSYWRVHLSGDFSTLPMRIERKIPRKRLQKKVATRTGFKVEVAEPSDYFGFELDGDGRYLMGDFTVTHNTVFAVEIMRRLGVLTAILVDKDKLKNQWIERIKSQLPGIRVGILQENRCDMDADVIVCMLDSMVNREHEALYEETGLVIADEVHHMGARTRVPIISRFSGPWRLGLSAKPHRIDGLDRAFYDCIGPKTYAASIRRLTARVFFRKTYWRPVTTHAFNPEKVSDQTILTIMIASKERNTMIVADILKAVSSGRKCIVFSDRRKHLDSLRDIFVKSRPAGKTDGFLRGGMSVKELKTTDKCDVLWATYEFAKEAYDNEDIDTVVLATPKSDPEQPVGRGTRWKPGKKEPFVLDYVDSGPSVMERKHNRRIAVYKQIKASIGMDDK